MVIIQLIVSQLGMLGPSVGGDYTVNSFTVRDMLGPSVYIRYTVGNMLGPSVYIRYTVGNMLGPSVVIELKCVRTIKRSVRAQQTL